MEDCLRWNVFPVLTVIVVQEPVRVAARNFYKASPLENLKLILPLLKLSISESIWTVAAIYPLAYFKRS